MQPTIRRAWVWMVLGVLLITACAPVHSQQIDVVPPAPVVTVEQVTRVATMVAAVEATATIVPMEATATTAPTATMPPTPAPTRTVNFDPAQLDCAASFERRELKEPYQRNKGNEARYTLSGEEVQALFARIGIKTMCLPTELGAPFINADWDAASTPGTERGMMVSLGFEGLYPGAGWSQGYVVAATYDFRAPTEYDTFATPEDIDALRNGKLPNRAIRTFEAAGGVMGFQRVAAGMGMGRTPLFMTYVIPSDTGYVAVVYTLGNYEGDLQPIMDSLSRGKYPEGVAKMVALFGAMAASVEK